MNNSVIKGQNDRFLQFHKIFTPKKNFRLIIESEGHVKGYKLFFFAKKNHFIEEQKLIHYINIDLL